MVRSREPEESTLEPHARAPARVRWPVIVRTRAILWGSQICTSPWFVPTARYDPRMDQATVVRRGGEVAQLRDFGGARAPEVDARAQPHRQLVLRRP
eukprot:CAMPEP_0114268202 /NCGR_PEP_ID=MMETSP0058-20121206/25801_1 /TAXON_ID=36894 /ORGANISM="Pyramimonas parkeae, CCMP726" /LENGTH=96 /DNA_ID=CAMNT_0001386301 /DNA_START=771 /DNA_END=1058 /DNA_ORIENTATION=+